MPICRTLPKILYGFSVHHVVDNAHTLLRIDCGPLLLDSPLEHRLLQSVRGGLLVCLLVLAAVSRPPASGLGAQRSDLGDFLLDQLLMNEPRVVFRVGEYNRTAGEQLAKDVEIEQLVVVRVFPGQHLAQQVPIDGPLHDSWALLEESTAFMHE